MDKSALVLFHEEQAFAGACKCRLCCFRSEARIVGRPGTYRLPVRSIPTKDFEFSAAEESRIRSVVKTGDSYGAGSDPGWLERVLAARWPAGNLNRLPVGRSYRVSS
jgi:hypothetical protein